MTGDAEEGMSCATPWWMSAVAQGRNYCRIDGVEACFLEHSREA